MSDDRYPTTNQPLIPMSEDDAALELASFIGEDWEEVLARYHGHPAQVSPADTPGAENRAVNVACERALDLAREHSGRLTESGEQVVRAAWFTLWVNAEAGTPQPPRQEPDLIGS